MTPNDPYEPRVAFPGPLSHHEVVVDGWAVPHLVAHPHGESDDKIMLVLDGRLATTFTVEEAERFVPFLADAIAIALGFSCHPREDEEPIWKPSPRPIRIRSVAATSEEMAE